VLQIEALHAGYGQARVIHGLSLTVQSNERFGLFGPNGHGKTTLLRTISGLIRPSAGLIRFNSVDLVRCDPRAIVELGVIHVAQGSVMFPDLTVAENLLVGSYPRRARAERDRRLRGVFDLFPRLGERRRQLARTLSGGERQMLAIGVGLMGNPELLMLDEPTLGLAPLVKDALEAAIAEIVDSGLTLLLVDQDVEFLLGLTQRLGLLEQGLIRLEASASGDLDDQEVLEMYFGARPS
jgi:branched-chain amino acid transport system ATP-binding protein